MKYIKVVIAVTLIVAAQVTIASAQTSPEIERLTAAIAKAPENDLLYIERARLYTWKNKWIGPNVPFADIGKTIDDNRAKALTDADMAIKINPRSYKAFALRAYLINAIGSYSGRKTYQQDLETAAKLRNESNIVASILKFDLSGGKMLNPPYIESVPVLNVIVKGEPIGSKKGFDTLVAAKDFGTKAKQPHIVMFNKEPKKYFLYEAFVTENIWPNVSLAETPFSKALKGKSTIPLAYEYLKIEPEYSVQPVSNVAAPYNDKLQWQFIDILDAEGLTLLKDEKVPLLNGSKGVRLLFDSELAKSNFDEALKIYNWYDKRNTASNANDLDVVKITRKTNLSKIYQYAEKLRPFVEKEMTKWKYTEADKIAVRAQVK